jgi:DNA-binding MarR family transcriptional regulator
MKHLVGIMMPQTGVRERGANVLIGWTTARGVLVRKNGRQHGIDSFTSKVILQVYLSFCTMNPVMSRKPLETSVIDLTQALGLLVRRLRAAAAADEVSLTESAVMARLAREGPATTADLARAEGMKPQSMGTTIAALEEMGMVERKPHPTDGRQVNIELTAKGGAVRKSRKDAKRTWLAQAISQLDEHERDTLFQAGEIIRRLAEK